MAGEGALTFLVASCDNSWELFFRYELLTVQSHVLESTSQPLIFFSCVPISTRLCCNKKKVFPTRSREWEEKIVGQNSKLDFFFFSLLCRSECYEDLTSSHCARHSEGSTLAWNLNSSPLLFFRFSSIDNNKTVMKIECRFNFHIWKCVCSESRRRSRANYELTILFTRLITVHLHRENSSRERGSDVD